MGRVKTVTDPLGRVVEYQYDNLGRKAAELLPEFQRYDGQSVRPTTRFGYDAVGNLRYTTDALGSTAADTAHTTWYFYDMLNRQVCTVEPPGPDYTISDDVPPASQPNYSVLTAYDALGNVVSTTDELGHVTTYVYDNLGRKIRETLPNPGDGSHGAPVTRYGYDANGNLWYVTDPLGNTAGDMAHTTWYRYDALNRRTQVIDALDADPSNIYNPNDSFQPNHPTTTAYDAAGNVTSVTDPENNITRYAYDRLNRQTTETDPLSHPATFKYDKAGNLIQTTDREGRITQYVYDSASRQVEERWLDGGQIIHTIHTWYDPAGQVIGVTQTDPSSDNRVRYQYSYDSLGNVTSERMARSDSGQALPVPNSGTLGDGQYESWADWDADETSERIDSTMQYLTAGQVLFAELTSTAFDGVLLVRRPGSTSWTDGWLDKDSAGRGNAYLVLTADVTGWWELGVTSFNQWAAGAWTLNLLVNSNSFVSNPFATFTYGYDEVGNLKKVIDSSGATTEYEYTTRQQTSRVKQTVSGTVNKRAYYEYRLDGQRQTVTRYRSNNDQDTVGTTTYSTYDNIGRLKQMQHVYGSTTRTYQWGYDAASRITSMSSNATDEGTNTFTLDATNQLKGATLTGEDYTYDDNGNRTSSSGVSWTPGTGNRLSSDATFTYIYDDNGNRKTRTRNQGTTDDHLTEYEWDHRNRLKKITFKNNSGAVKRTLEYIYDASNRLVREFVNLDGSGGLEKSPTYVYQGNEIALEYDAAGQLKHRYLWGPAVDELLADEQIGGELLWAYADHEGTIRDVSDSQGNQKLHRQYNTFGRMLSKTGTVDLLFASTGRLLDQDSELAANSGLQFNLNRWYDPRATVWISADPSGFSAGDMNLYRYVGNNPVALTDPSGLQSYGGTGFTGSTIGAIGSALGNSMSIVPSDYGLGGLLGGSVRLSGYGNAVAQPSGLLYPVKEDFASFTEYLHATKAFQDAHWTQGDREAARQPGGFLDRTIGAASAHFREVENIEFRASADPEWAEEYAVSLISCGNLNAGAAGVGAIAAANYIRGTIPSWRQSEVAAGKQFGLQGNQESVFLDGEKLDTLRRVKDSSVPEYYERGDPAKGVPGQSYEVKRYNVEIAARQRRLIADTASQAVKRVRSLPPGTQQNIIVDVRGRTLKPGQLEQIAKGLEAKSGGVIKAENVSFMRGSAPSAARTALRVGGGVVVAAGAAYDIYRIGTAENKARTISAVAGGWAGAWAFGTAGAAGGAAVGSAFFGVGAVPGACIGFATGAIAGFFGYWAGSKAGENVYDTVTE